MNLGIRFLPIMRHCRNYGPVEATLSNLGSGFLSQRHNAVQTPDRGHRNEPFGEHTVRSMCHTIEDGSLPPAARL
jgi:hypothetical protein